MRHCPFARHRCIYVLNCNIYLIALHSLIKLKVFEVPGNGSILVLPILSPASLSRNSVLTLLAFGLFLSFLYVDTKVEAIDGCSKLPGCLGRGTELSWGTCWNGFQQTSKSLLLYQVNLPSLDLLENAQVFTSCRLCCSFEQGKPGTSPPAAQHCGSANGNLSRYPCVVATSCFWGLYPNGIVDLCMAFFQGIHSMCCGNILDWDLCMAIYQEIHVFWPHFLGIFFYSDVDPGILLNATSVNIAI